MGLYLLSGSSDLMWTLSPLLTALGGKMVGTTVRKPSRALGVRTGSGTGYETWIPLKASPLKSYVFSLALAWN